MRTYESGTPCHKHPTVAEHLFALTLVECYIRSITDRIRICNVRHLEYDKVHVTSLGVRKQAGHIARLCEICLPHGASPGLRLSLTHLAVRRVALPQPFQHEQDHRFRDHACTPDNVGGQQCLASSSSVRSGKQHSPDRRHLRPAAAESTATA